MFSTLPVLLLYLLNIPLALLAAYIAYAHGQSLKKWLFIGLALPFVSVFLAVKTSDSNLPYLAFSSW